MITTFITCYSCDNTEGFQLSQTLAECTSCSNPVTLTDEIVFHKREIIPLHQIAKEQALKDILIMGSFDSNGDIIDWANCFDINNIEPIRVA